MIQQDEITKRNEQLSIMAIEARDKYKLTLRVNELLRTKDI